jgi:hypothetical protein
VKLTGTAILALVALVGGAFVLVRYGPSLLKALNPANPDNVVNAGASSLVQTISGGAAAGGEDTVGGVLARAREFLSGDDAKIQAMLSGATPAPGTAASEPANAAGVNVDGLSDEMVIPFGA